MNSDLLKLIPPVIGVAANRRGVGKTTFCKTLKERLEGHGIKVVCRDFADPLREITANILKLILKDEENVLQFLYEKKDNYLPGANYTGRDMMITVANACRQTFGADIFAERYAKYVRYYLTVPLKVLTGDVRFPEEVKTIRQFGGKIVYLVGEPLQEAQQSEGAIDPSNCDIVLERSNKTPDQLVDEFLSAISPHNVIPFRRRG